jgi:abhydrolase domain-containing protein 12
LTFDYRDFGKSTGSPSETGLIIDAVAVVDWAMNVAEIPPSRILIFAQSMGTAVSIAVSKHLALPVVFAGTVLIAPFVDVQSCHPWRDSHWYSNTFKDSFVTSG